MTEEQSNRFFDGITAHNKDILDREKDSEKRTEDFFDMVRRAVKHLPHYVIKFYPEDSRFNDCGSKSDIDVFFKKINAIGMEYELVEYLKEYLTDDELKERLSEDNFMSSVIVQKFIDDYLKRKKIKAIENKIRRKEHEISKVKNAFEKFKEGKTYQPPRPESNLNERMIEHIERELYEFDFDKFLTEE